MHITTHFSAQFSALSFLFIAAGVKSNFRLLTGLIDGPEV